MIVWDFDQNVDLCFWVWVNAIDFFLESFSSKVLIQGDGGLQWYAWVEPARRGLRRHPGVRAAGQFRGQRAQVIVMS